MNDHVYVDTISKGDNGLFTVGGSIVHEDGRGKPFAVDLDQDVMEYICEEVVLHLDSTGYTDAVVDAVMEAIKVQLCGDEMDQLDPGIIFEGGCR